MLIFTRILNGIAFVAILLALVGAVDLAFAGPRPCSVCGVPGPIAGAGLPILAIAGGAYWLARRLRRRPS